jgi:hypothetical protein
MHSRSSDSPTLSETFRVSVQTCVTPTLVGLIRPKVFVTFVFSGLERRLALTARGDFRGFRRITGRRRRRLALFRRLG